MLHRGIISVVRGNQLRCHGDKGALLLNGQLFDIGAQGLFCIYIGFAPALDP